MEKTMNLILVPTDFSDHSCEAFEWASIFANQFGAKVLILHVMPEAAAEEIISVPGNPWEKVLESEDKTMIDNYNACLATEASAKVEKETLVAVGHDSTEIVNVAKERDASIIVMATHGRTGITHALMGSVAEKVVRSAPCPVFTVRPGEAG